MSEIVYPRVGVALLDLRSQQPDPPPLYRGKRKHKLYRGKVVQRDPKKVTGVTIHQTACIFGPLKDPIARHRRALGVACHALSFGIDRTVVLANPLRSYVWHGNGFNAYELGLEVEGHFSGLLDDPRTTPRREDIETMWNGKTPTQMTADILETACEALRILVELGRLEGMPIEYVHAHRQSSGTRRADPGEGIWRDLILGFAVPVLNLKTQPRRAIGTGRPIPRTWDPSAVARY